MVNGINHITLSVRDIQESFEFYKEILGLTPVMLSAKSAYFKAGETWLSLREEKDKEQNNNLLSHIALNVAPEHYKTIEVFLVKFKADIWKDDTIEGDSFFFKDPSGNKLQIHYSDLDTRIKYGKEHWGDDVQWFV